MGFLFRGGDSDESGGRTFTDIANEAYSSNTLGNSGLSFDVSEFKAKKEVRALSFREIM